MMIRPGEERTDNDDDLDALLRLVLCGGPVAVRRGLLEAHGGPAKALAAGPAAWRVAGLSPTQIGQLHSPEPVRLARSRQWLSAPRHCLVGWHAEDYPPLLRRAPAPPLALFIDGDPSVLWHPSVAMVGSRSPTPGGRDNARDFADAFTKSGLAVFSGLAAGIDTAAHEAALAASGLTAAVLGTGPDMVYPRGNTGLQARIAEQGALVTEHPPGTGPRKEHFPSRNRILAGLSLATLVIEAAERSGALITARLASDAGRDVFAVPGSIHNPLSRGCHRLIRDGAGLVENAAEVVDALAPVATELAGHLRQRLGIPTSDVPADPDPRHRKPEPAPVGNRSRTPPDDPQYNIVWNALGHDPTGMDQLAARTGLTTATLSSMLLLMELDGRISTHHGRYIRHR